VLRKRLARRLLQQDLAISAGARQQTPAKATGELARLSVRRRVPGIGRADDVAIVIAARGYRIESSRHDALDVLLQLLLGHAVELEGLAGRQAQLAVRGRARLRVESKPLRGRTHTPGQA